jgi:hypothetical protein
MGGDFGGLRDFVERNPLLEPRANEVQVRFRAIDQRFDVGSHRHSLPRIELGYRTDG